MVSSLRMVVATVSIIVLGQPLIYARSGQNKIQEDKLIARIDREQNPGKKARLQLHLAKIKLSEAHEAYRARNFAEGNALLQQYLAQVRETWATLQGADGGPRKHLGAYKDFEISLREEDRLLDDLSHQVPYPESESIEAVAKESRTVHNQVLEAIFPPDVSRKERSKR
ncbi:MAG TPA: hypothetical protein VGW37_01945 [Terriglobia bacterium]|nr:hypothetical protein [Terriglobia bacterium]